MKSEIKKTAGSEKDLRRNGRGMKLAYCLLVLLALIPGIVGFFMEW